MTLLSLGNSSLTLGHHYKIWHDAAVFFRRFSTCYQRVESKEPAEVTNSLPPHTAADKHWCSSSATPPHPIPTRQTGTRSWYLPLGRCTAPEAMGSSYSVSAQSAFDYAQKGDTRSLQTLLAEVQRRGIDVTSFVEHRDVRGMTPLMAAAAGGHAETVGLVRTPRAMKCAMLSQALVRRRSVLLLPT